MLIFGYQKVFDGSTCTIESHLQLLHVLVACEVEVRHHFLWAPKVKVPNSIMDLNFITYFLPK